jgi:hypothetical protein
MEFNDARRRNLKIKLFKIKLSKGKIYEQHFTKESINKKLFFKKSDISQFINDFFESSGEEHYVLKKEIQDSFEEFFKKHEEYVEQQEQLEEELDRYYKQIKNIFLNFEPSSKAQNLIEEAKDIAAKLHWLYLPIYPEQSMINSDLIPEEDVHEYYSHFHMIEDLYRVIFEDAEIDWNNIEGDINLNTSMKMKLYSVRWGHDDIYSVMRTVDGWTFKHLSYNLSCDIDGTIKNKERSGFYKILDHDSIQYPYDGVKYALESLWKEADKESMTVQDLQKKLQEVADWISEVEKTIKLHQPTWVGYY